jgi:hypothetical protein
MKTGTHHNESRMEARNIARKLWMIYSELVRAGFREDQSLALLLKLIAVEGSK